MTSLIPPPSLAEPDALGSVLQQQGYAVLDAHSVSTLSHCPLADLAALRPLWAGLPPDAFLKDGGRYRRRRHSCFVVQGEQVTQVPHRAHWQPVAYNALHGGFERWFEPLDTAMASSPAFLAVVQRLGEVFAAAAHDTPSEPPFDGRWFIEAHPFRIDTTGGVGRPTPEGAHRDGVNFVAVLLVAREGVVGGETRVFQADGPHGVRFTLEQPWSALLLDDPCVVHESTPIQPDGAAGWRDTLVLTYRAGDFQDPPRPVQ